MDSINALTREAFNLFFKNQQYDVAWKLNNQALLLAEKEQHSHPEKVIEILEQQAHFHEKLQQFYQEKTTLLRLIDIEEKTPELAARYLGKTLYLLANSYVAQNDYKSAEATLLRAISILEPSSDTNAEILTKNYLQLSDVYLAQQRLEIAEVPLQQALKLIEEKNQIDLYWQQLTFRKLEKIYRNSKREDLANKMAMRFVNIKPGLTAVPDAKPKGTFKGAVIKPGNCQQPEYPREALIKELQGATQLRFLVNENGHIIAKYISKSSGWKILDDAVFEKLSTCKFEPASVNDNPVTSWFGYQYTWKLE
ncbi:TonB family protein [Undibacterium sp. Di27W]|uniref:TonB family protein n=1 Tax=Undibacterium sp. Di27W TaxID=3413036 RepID=UPI003BF531AF